MIENVESRKRKVVVLFEVIPTEAGKKRYCRACFPIKTIAFRCEGIYSFRTIQ